MRQTKPCIDYFVVYSAQRGTVVLSLSQELQNYRSLVHIARKPYFNFIYFWLLKRRKTFASYVGHVKRVQNFYSNGITV